MEASVFTQVLLPLSLALIMFGMGLTLTPSDFTRLFKAPVAVSAGLFGQLIGLPLLAFAMISALEVPYYIAIGLMVLAACPGGTSSNLLSYLGRANLALSVSLTAITTIVCIVSTPWIIKFSIDHFAEVPDTHFSLLNTSLSLLIISLVPIAIGMTVRRYALHFAQRSEGFFRHLSSLFLLALIIIIAIDEFTMLKDAFPDVFFITFSLNIIATIVGVLLAKLAKLNVDDALTLGIEVGTQNATMAILIAVTFMSNPSYSIAAGVYGVTMYVGAFALIIVKRKGWLSKVYA